MNKKLAQIAVHLTQEDKEALMGLAEIEGQSVSEFVGNIIGNHLHSQLDKLSVLQRWAQQKRSDSSESTE